jgi:hypothetical protein
MKKILYTFTAATMVAGLYLGFHSSDAKAQSTTNGEDAVQSSKAKYVQSVNDYEKSVKRSDELMAAQEERAKRVETLLEAQEAYYKRLEALMSRQEAEFGRYEKILDTWEQQQKQYQKYLDSLVK